MKTRNNKKSFWVLQFVAVLVMFLAFSILPILSANAAENYVPLAPIPGVTSTDGSGTTLSSYITGMFRIGIAVAGVLAFLMIVLGGFEYLSTDAIMGKEEGKERITRALGGLALALVSYIILYTINPQLLSLNFASFSSSTVAKEGLSALPIFQQLESEKKTILNQVISDTAAERLQIDTQIANETNPTNQAGLRNFSSTLVSGRGSAIQLENMMLDRDLTDLSGVQAGFGILKSSVDAAYDNGIGNLRATANRTPENLALSNRLAEEKQIQDSYLDKTLNILSLNAASANNGPVATLNNIITQRDQYTQSANQNIQRLNGLGFTNESSLAQKRLLALQNTASIQIAKQCASMTSAQKTNYAACK